MHRDPADADLHDPGPGGFVAPIYRELDARRAGHVQAEPAAGALDDTGLGHTDHTCHMKNSNHTRRPSGGNRRAF